MPEKIESFQHNSRPLKAEYQETTEVTQGVFCDVYTHPETQRRDLAIVSVEPGYSTPIQRIAKGKYTIEGYVSGNGVLTIQHTDGSKSEFPVDASKEGFSHTVEVGELMQWKADSDASEPLVFFEICFPPYEDGRFEVVDNWI